MDGTDRNANAETSGTNSTANQCGIQSAIAHMKEKKIDTFLWLTRIGTLIFTVLSLLPILSTHPYSSYYRALLCSAATSALRLHQRMPPFRFTQSFVMLLMSEDSCHYLIYSVLFLLSYPITLSLLPIFMFALLHSVHFSLIVLNKLGYYETVLNKALKSIAANYSHSILRLVAFSEIFMMAFVVIMVFSAKLSLLTIFAYYRFLTFRYGSRRNPYTRSLFHEMRLSLEAFANTPGRNESLRRFCNKIIQFTTYLAPPVIVERQEAH